MITDRNEVTKKGTMPKTSNDSFNWLPSLVSRVKMNIKPVRVKYLHFTMNWATLLKKGNTDKYANNRVIRIEYSIAFPVSSRLTNMLSSNNLLPSNCTNALAILPGLGISPSDNTCHNNIVITTCTATIITNVC